MAGPVLELRNLTKEISTGSLEPFVIFKNISLSVREGEFVSIVGPSGCGKTTLLRVINGLLSPSSGQIFIDGKEQTGSDNE
ncbi:MAG: ATP-binding cassette domain-containing protein, partial [Candidatus Binatota bacterium]